PDAVTDTGLFIAVPFLLPEIAVHHHREATFARAEGHVAEDRDGVLKHCRENGEILRRLRAELQMADRGLAGRCPGSLGGVSCGRFARLIHGASPFTP